MSHSNLLSLSLTEGVTNPKNTSKKKKRRENFEPTFTKSWMRRSLAKNSVYRSSYPFDIANDARFNEKGKKKKRRETTNLLPLDSGDNRTNFEARRSTIDPLPPIPITRRIPSSGDARRKSAQRSPTLKPRPLSSLFFFFIPSPLPPYNVYNVEPHLSPLPFVVIESSKLPRRGPRGHRLLPPFPA